MITQLGVIMSESGIIYVTQNRLNGKIYVGIHTLGQKDYLGSGTYLNRAIKKYERENFERIEIEKFDTIKEGCALERLWIQELDSKFPNGYNLCDGGEGVFNPCQEVRDKHMGKNNPSTRLNVRAKISATLTGHLVSDETRAKLSVVGVGKHLTKETRAKISARLKGKPSRNKGKSFSEERKAKMKGKPAWNKGKKGQPLGKETKAKISARLKGKPISEETKAKISVALKGNKNPMFGKHLSKEHKDKMSVSLKGKGHSNSEETKAKISATLTGKPWSSARRATEDRKRLITNRSGEL